MRRAFALVAVLCLTLSGCRAVGRLAGFESQEKDSRNRRATATPGSNEGGTTAPGAPGSETGDATPGLGRTPSGGEAPASQQPDATPSPLPPYTATLDQECVRRGNPADLQGLTVKTTAGDTVIYSTAYSDGSNEFSHPEYKSGWGYGNAVDGTFRAKWVTPKEAPTGSATVHIFSHTRGSLKLSFTVAELTGTCP